MTRKAWQEDDNLVVARLVLVVNNGDPNPVVPEGHPEYVRARNALGIDTKQLTARVNVVRSNHSDWRGGNPMNCDTIVVRVVHQMLTSPAYVKMAGRAVIERLEEETQGQLG